MREKELRLALICYGGISLAVYMHGITKEVWHLLRASRAHLTGLPPTGGTAPVYAGLLELIEDSARLRLRVINDIVTGASAGGINGIFLAQAIVEGKSLEPLTDLWLDVADVETLLDPDARPGPYSKLWAVPIAWQMLRQRGVVERTVSPEAQTEIERKLSHFVRARWFAPPFGGERFCHLMLDAAEAMDRQGSGETLLPDNHPLDLIVTCTDFHGHRERLRLNSPAEVTETEHRLAIGFTTRRGQPGRLAPLPELVFAARATASFPGAFPPFTARELDAVLADRGLAWEGRDAFLARILPVQHREGRAGDTVLIDGSVLANAPFTQAIAALRNRPARREVDRRFVYIDPIPDVPVFRFGQRSAPGDVPVEPPGFFTTIFGASSNIPREQPIRDNLEEIERRSARIRHMAQVTRNLRPEVEQTVESMLGSTWFLSRPTPRRLAQWRANAQERAARAAGFSYAAYGHLKIAGIVEELLALVNRALPGAEGARRSALRDALWSELRTRGLEHISGPGGLGASPEAIEFFRQHDMRFRIRRLRFLLRRLAEDVEAADNAPEEAVEAMQDALFGCLSLYVERASIDRLGDDFADCARVAADQPAMLVDLIAARRALVEADEEVDGRLCAALVALPPKERRDMLLAYVGFPLIDIATLPLLQEEAVDEFDPIKVDRISPEDATAIRGGAMATLKGIEFNTFGAFFSRAYRENDYLWGRLHGADRLIDIVLSTVAAHQRPPGGDIDALKKRAFAAILDEEEARLGAVPDLIASLRAEIGPIQVET